MGEIMSRTTTHRRRRSPARNGWAKSDVTDSRPPQTPRLAIAVTLFLAASLVGITRPAFAQDASGETLPPPAASSAAEATAAAGLPGAGLGSAGTATAGRGATMFHSLSTASHNLCTRIKNSPIGKLVGGLRKPLSMATGGLIPGEPTPSAKEQTQGGAAGTAAQVKAAALEAPKRQAAVQALKGVDVRYHPEAEGALIAALRTDPSECVRYDAALVLTTLPVCTKKIADALKVSVESSQSDGNPAELSPRVRLQAEVALGHCEACMPPGTESNDRQRPEYPGPTPPTGPTGNGTVAPVSAIETVTAIEPSARRNPTALSRPLMIPPGETPPHPTPRRTAPTHTSPKNLAEILRAARNTTAN